MNDYNPISRIFLAIRTGFDTSSSDIGGSQDASTMISFFGDGMRRCGDSFTSLLLPK